MKPFYYFLIAFLAGPLSYGQISESFDTGLPTSFQTGSYALPSGTWDLVSARNEQNSSRARTGASAAKLQRNTSPNSSITTPVLSGAGTVTFWYRKLRTQDASGTISLQWSTDGTTYTTLATQAYANQTYTPLTFDINSPSNLRIRILNDTNAGRVIIDDFEVTAYSGPPSNDNLADAIPISCGNSYSGNTSLATIDEIGAPDISTIELDTDADNDSPNVWYSFIGTGDPVTLSTCANTTFDSEILVFTGTSGNLTLIDDGFDECDPTGTSNYEAETTFTSVLGTTYLIAVEGWNPSDVGAFELSVICPLSNDDLANAIPVSCGNTYSGNTSLATIDESGAPDISTIEPDTDADNDSPNVWYAFIGTGDPVTLSTCANTTFDSEILVFTGTSGNLTLIDDGFDECDPSGASNYEAETTFTSVLGTRYLIAVEGWNPSDVGAFELSVICTPPAPVTYTFTNGTWSPSDPIGIATANDNLVIAAGDATISTNTTCNTVTVNPGASLTVSPASTILQLDGASGLTLQSNSASYSSFIVDGSIVGTVNYERHANSLGLGNDLIALPLMPNDGLNFDTFLGLGTPTNASKLATNGTFYAFAPYNNTTPAYENFTVGGTDALVKAKGYRVATNVADALLTFSGTVEPNNVSIPISNPTGGSQWNLVGNPYPSYISASEFLAANTAVLDPAATAIYGYNANTYSGGGDTVGNFTIINNVTNTSLAIAPGQGFFLAANNTPDFTGNIVFNNGSLSTTDMRTLTGNDDFIEGRSAVSYNLKLDLIASNTTRTSFYFNDNSSLGLDPGYDAAVYGALGHTHPLYSLLVENNVGRAMALQSLHTSDLNDLNIALGVNGNQGEQLRFSIAEANLPSAVAVYLEDTLKQTTTLLTDADYVLTPATDLNGTGRFFLKFSNSALSLTESDFDAIKVYTERATRAIYVQGVLIGDMVATLYDLNGRLLHSAKLDSASSRNQIQASNVADGVYVLTLSNGQQQKSQKVILR